MIIGKVVGKVISTRKNEDLVGCKFLVVEVVSSMANEKAKLVAVDNVGAGFGDVVMVVQGSAARLTCGDGSIPIDAAVVGIVDDGTGLE
jgi:ethanolamine utilization protein EutN